MCHLTELDSDFPQMRDVFIVLTFPSKFKLVLFAYKMWMTHAMPAIFRGVQESTTMVSVESH